MGTEPEGTPERPRTREEPRKKLTLATPPMTGKLKTGRLHPLPPSPRFPALTGPLDPWPEILELIGTPTILVDLRTGEVDEGRLPPIGEVDLAVLRVIAQRKDRPAHRWLIHELAFQRQGDASRVNDAVADLKQALGEFGNRIETAGKDAWRLWPGPD